MTDTCHRHPDQRHANANFDLARLLARVAAELDERGYSRAGVVRRAARALLDGPETEPGGCRGCGGPLPTSPKGRPRQWCSEPCRRRHRP